MLPFTAIDCALLLAEWNVANCPACDCTEVRGHLPGCLMDQALSERGFPTQEDRQRARERVRAAGADTEAPPAPPTPADA